MKLQGKLIISGIIKTNTGLHIGGSSTGIDIGGMDNSVIKDATGRPYIPGSSIKGKMRSLLEIVEGKYSGSLKIERLKKNVEEKRKYDRKDYEFHNKFEIKDNDSLQDALSELEKIKNDLKTKKKKYTLNVKNCNCGEIDCAICRIFGTGASDGGLSGGTRLYVRDSYLANSQEMIKKQGEFSELEFDYTESKTENALDRFNSSATPRTLERVPAGAKFNFEFVYNIYDKKDLDNIDFIRQAINLLEDDYIGGNGSRGYGEIKFNMQNLEYKSSDCYKNSEIKPKILSSLDEVKTINFGE